MMRAVPPLLLLVSLARQAPSTASLPDLVNIPLRTGDRNPADSAVIVGIEDYFVVQDVPYASRDADAFQNFVLYTKGLSPARIRRIVSVPGSNQANRETLVEALGRAGQETRSGGTVWVFFSGHGAADPANPKKRLLLGQDVMGTESSFAARGISLEEVRNLAGTGGAEVVMILDACYAGAGRTGEALLPGTHFVVPLYASSLSAGLEWDAAGPNQLSRPLESVSQGAFSYFSIGALRGWADGELDGKRNGDVTAEEAQAYVTRMLRVAGLHAQEPVMMGDTKIVLSKGSLEVGPADGQLTVPVVPVVPSFIPEVAKTPPLLVPEPKAPADNRQRQAGGGLRPYEEIAKTPPPGGDFMKVSNWSTNWMAIEVQEWKGSSVTTNRVFGADDVLEGIYLDGPPQVDGQTTVRLNGADIEVPVVRGNLVAALEPCLGNARVPGGYMAVNADLGTITLIGRPIVAMDQKADLVRTLAWDATKGTLVRAPLGTFGRLQGRFARPWNLFDAVGNRVTFGRPFTDFRIGESRCRT